MVPDPPEDTLRETMEELARAISESPRTCPSCGQAVPDDVTTCPSCGAALPPERAEPPPPPPPEEPLTEAETPTAAPTVEVVPPQPEAPPAPAQPPAPEELAPPLADAPPVEPPPLVETTVQREEPVAAPQAQAEPAAVKRVTVTPSRGRLWAPVAVGAIAYLVAIPGLFSGRLTTIPAAVLMFLGAAAVAAGVGLFAASGRTVELAAPAVVTEYVCPLCGTDVAPDATVCPTCGARLTD